MNRKVSIIDYGVGNLLNVIRAFKHCDASVEVVETASQIRQSGRLVLPGVGAFPDGMAELGKRDLIDAILQHSKNGKPFMGICLGMQMLFDSSEEFGTKKGLGIIPGGVVPIPKQGVGGVVHKIPHIGWNELIPPPEKTWENTILEGVGNASAVYFVHSFMAMPDIAQDLLAWCDYDGCKITAVVQHGNSIGCQFHPEKSSEVGLRIINNFIGLD